MRQTPGFVDEQEQLRRARGKADEFQRKLETRLYRFHPDDFIPEAAAILEKALDDIQVMRQWPAHHLLHAMEANCAYFRKYLREPVAEEDLAKTINTYHQHLDPFSEYTLRAKGNTEGVEMFMAAMSRQQFHLQRVWGGDDFARGTLLFDGSLYPKTRPLFEAKFGVNFSHWQNFCFALSAGLERRPNGFIGESYINVIADLFPPQTIPVLFGLASIDADTVRAEYIRLRQDHALYDPFLPSILTRRPLFHRSKGDYVAVSKRLVLGHASETIYGIAKRERPDTFPGEFGEVFERYVGKLLGEMESVTAYPEREVKRLVKDGTKVADYVVASGNAVLLVECKAIEQTARLPHEKAIEFSNEATKIRGAMEQLASTARLVTSGQLDSLLGPLGARKVIAAILTFKHIPLANMGIYWRHTGVPTLEESGDIQRFAFRPQVMDIVELEKLVGATKRLRKSVLDFYVDKLSQSDFIVGEWTPYLTQKDEPGYMLPMLRTALDSWSGNFGARLAAVKSSAPLLSGT